MSTHLLCLTSSGGLPIFNRKKGETDSLPFSTIGSLNGVHMFCKSQGVQLKTTYLEDGLVVWREFENCITLIVAAKGIPERVVIDLMQLVFDAMVLCLGLTELRRLTKNAENLKRELKPFYPVIDKILDSIDTDLLRFSDCLMTPVTTPILERLAEFSERIGSPFCCVLAYHKILAGTEGWWDLHVADRKLLIALLSGSTVPNPPDYPVYLPHKSPDIAYRFVCVPIWQNVSVCVVCGAEPRYGDIEQLVQTIWNRSEHAILEAAEICYPRNFPASVQFSNCILGAILINLTHSKYIMSRNIQQTSSGKRATAGGHRLDILRMFFHQAVDVMEGVLSIEANKTDADNNDDTITRDTMAKSSEMYWCSDYHKCHAYRLESNLICVLYTAAIPTHSMRIITQKTLNLIISEKDISW